MFQWLTTTFVGKVTATFLISMVPFVELRLGLPYGLALGLDTPVAVITAVIGNLVPAPLIILFIRRIFAWLRNINGKVGDFVNRIERKGLSKADFVRRIGPVGLIIFVAIPLPGTGAWTGALIAALLDIRVRRAIPCILIGLCISATIMTLVTMGVIHIL